MHLQIVSMGNQRKLVSQWAGATPHVSCCRVGSALLVAPALVSSADSSRYRIRPALGTGVGPEQVPAKVRKRT